MKATREPGSRTIKITDMSGIVGDFDKMPTELEITVNYVTVENEGGAVPKAITLDNKVIPIIVDALNKAKG